MTDWTEIKTQADADLFLKTAHYLHDYFLKEAHLLTPSFAGSPTSIRLVFPDTWRSDQSRVLFELLFEEVIQFNFVPSPREVDCIIHECVLIVLDGSALWCDDEDFLKEASCDKKQMIWISAKRIFWRQMESIA